jgi:hypothetical protein
MEAGEVGPGTLVFVPPAASPRGWDMGVLISDPWALAVPPGSRRPASGATP